MASVHAAMSAPYATNSRGRMTTGCGSGMLWTMPRSKSGDDCSANEAIGGPRTASAIRSQNARGDLRFGMVASVDAIEHHVNHDAGDGNVPVSYTHLRAHETPEHLVCRLLL